MLLKIQKKMLIQENVEAENKYVLSKGDLVVLIMSNDLAPKIKENFEKLKQIGRRVWYFQV